MKKAIITLFAGFLFFSYTYAQNIGIGTAAPNASSKLEINSTNSGLLIPRMTSAQRSAISSPATGLMIYQTDNTPGFYFYNGGSWIQFSTGSASNYWSLNGSNIFNNNAGNIGIGLTTPAAPLHIKKDLEAIRIQGSTPYVSFYDSTGTIKCFLQKYNDDFLLGTPATNTGGNLVFYLSNNINATLSAGGKFTVSGANPQVGFDGASHSGDISGVGLDLQINAKRVTGGFSTPGNVCLQLSTSGGSGLSAGNVGIAVPDPAFKLDVAGRIRLRGIPGVESAGIWLNNPDNATFAGFVGVAQNNTIGLYGAAYGWGLAMNTNNGNVGVGTVNPLARLHIAGDNEALRITGNQSYLSFYNGTAAYAGYLWNKGTWDMELGTASGNTLGSMNLSIRGTPSITIRNDGRMGTSGNPGVILINGYLPDFTVNGLFTVKGLNAEGGKDDEWAFQPSVHYAGFSNPYGALDVYKNGSFIALLRDDGDWDTPSDVSLKEDITLYKNVLDGIKNLRVSTYHLKKNKNSSRSFGLIAQNVAEYFPDVVSEFPGKDGQQLMGLCYAKTGVLAIKAIQEQQVIIEKQQKEIDKLNEQNEYILAALDKLLQNKKQ